MELAHLVRGCGDEHRGDWWEAGERGEKEKQSKEFPALDLKRELDFLRGEVQICVCASLFIYRALALALFVEPIYPSTLPLQTPVAPVSGNTLK